MALTHHSNTNPCIRAPLSLNLCFLTVSLVTRLEKSFLPLFNLEKVVVGRFCLFLSADGFQGLESI